MLKFKKIELADKEWIDKILLTTSRPSLEYNFTTLFIWQSIYNTSAAEKDGFLFIMAGKTSEYRGFMFPMGTGDVKKALGELDAYCKKENMPMIFYSLEKEHCEILESLYPGRFEFEESRDDEDYIYTAESLRTLTGKKLSSKRNHINRFVENNPDWTYEEMNRDNIPEAMDMHMQWCDNMDCKGNAGLQDETCAVRRAFKYFDELGLSGGILRAGGKIVAFTMGDELNENTFIVHIEKAYAEVQGAYPMINKQFVIHTCDNYEFVDREEDTGEEGLRRAKLSYQPYRLAIKYNAEEK